MLDLSVPFHPVIMICRQPENPCPHLPEGIRLTFWEPGREADWASIHMAAGQLGTMEKAMRVFQEEFAPHPQALRERMFFLCDTAGQPLATTTFWFGNDLGYTAPRLHWISCVPEYQGKGLGKLMMRISLRMYHELGCTNALYLTTQTTSYPAINIYKQFGFEPYLDPMPDNGVQWDNETAWGIIDQKLEQYRSRARRCVF